jgi:hypothetical protein
MSLHDFADLELQKFSYAPEKFLRKQLCNEDE